MGPLDRAIQSTQKYARFFGLPMSLANLERYLITSRPLKLSKNYRNTPKESRLIKSRQQISQDKIKLLESHLWLFKLIPTIDLVAITGSVAIHNAIPGDDIDIMIVTSNSSLWLTRFIVVILLKILGWRRSDEGIKDKICDNLYLDQSALTIAKNKRNLYTAHEVLQITPVIDRRHTYQRFIQSNSWTKKYLANAYQHCSSVSNISPLPSLKLRGGLGVISVINLFFFRLQYLFMRSKITNETISLHTAFFHPRDYTSDLHDALK